MKAGVDSEESVGCIRSVYSSDAGWPQGFKDGHG